MWRAVLLAAPLLIGCVASGVAQPVADQLDGTDLTTPVALVAYDSCGALLDGFRHAALTELDRTEQQRRVYGGARSGVAVSAPEATASSTGNAADHSSTTAHEVGVDEPDVAKTDGRRVVTVLDGELRVVDVASHQQTGQLALPTADEAQSSEFVLAGDRALVAQRAWESGRPVTRLLLVDLSAAPRLLGTLTVDGGYLDTRQVGGTARVVVHSTPHLPQPPAAQSQDEYLAGERAVIANSTVADWLPTYRLNASDYQGSGQLVDCARVSHPIGDDTGTAVLTVLTFDLARDLGTGDPVSVVADGDTVYGTGTSLYVADDHQARVVPMTGLARGAVVDAPAGFGPMRFGGGNTAVHQFDISQPGPPRYLASGRVAGDLVNQYALSEQAGVLRVATTTGQAACCGQPSTSESAVTTLVRHGGALEQLGRVGGLGRGERIRSVRFAGDTGYVVTFRQTDPLYTLNLADPAHPKVVGELALTGYSAFLQPTGAGQLIGVGQDASAQGRIQGTQVSLFDVHDPAAPTRLAHQVVPGAHSEAELDPHAFLYWPATGLVVIPLTPSPTTSPGVVSPVPKTVPAPGTSQAPVPNPGTSQAPTPNPSTSPAPVPNPSPVPTSNPTPSTSRAPNPSTSQASAPVSDRAPATAAQPAPRVSTLPLPVSQPARPGSALVLRVHDNTLTEVGTITDPAGGWMRRALVVGDELWTVSNTGLLVQDLTGLAQRAWLPWR